jgi:hypothetical protein
MPNVVGFLPLAQVGWLSVSSKAAVQLAVVQLAAVQLAVVQYSASVKVVPFNSVSARFAPCGRNGMMIPSDA